MERMERDMERRSQQQVLDFSDMERMERMERDVYARECVVHVCESAA